MVWYVTEWAALGPVISPVLMAVEAFVEAPSELPPGTPEGGRARRLLAQGSTSRKYSGLSPGTHRPGCRGMGTTMVAALVTGNLAYLLNIGDSRAYHITGSGIEKVTRDHSVVEDMVRVVTSRRKKPEPPAEEPDHQSTGDRRACAGRLLPPAAGSRRITPVMLRRIVQCSERPGDVVRGPAWRGSGGTVLPPAFGHCAVPGSSGQRDLCPLSV